MKQGALISHTEVRQFFVAVGILAALFAGDALLNGALGKTAARDTFPTSELGIAEVSPRGAAGGFAFPASPGSCTGEGCPTEESGCTGEGCPAEIEAEETTFSATPGTVNEGDDVSIVWDCANSTSASGLNFSTGGDPSGSTTVNPTDTTTYELYCENGDFAQRTVTVRESSVSITADPTLFRPGDTSEVSWSASGVNSCVVNGSDGFSASSGDISDGDTWNDSHTTGPLEEQTIYTITCETSTNTYTDKVILNINPIFEEI